MSRILVADDDLDICELVAFKLELLGHDVVVEHDGEGALAAAIETQPDLIVLDWMMPRMTGLEVCAAIRAREEIVEVPVIMLTAKAQESDIQLGFAAGADDYLLKPFSPRELGVRIDALLARSRSGATG